MGAYRELDALSGQLEEFQKLVEGLGPGEWDRPTRLGDWTVRELVAHTTGSIQRGTSLLGDSAEGEPTTSRVGWWRYDVEARAPKIAASAREEAAKRTDEELAEGFRRESEAILRALDRSSGDVVGRKGVTIRVADLAATRVVEVGIHTMDLGHATLRGEQLTKEAAEVIVEVLDGLLGEDLPKQLGWDTKTYILTAGDRRRMEPNERHTLGALALKFPLIR